MNKIEFGDCRDIMRQWAEQGVKAQMCVTSPPYYGLRDYGVDGQIGLEQTPEEYIAAMVEVFRCVRDVLADDGTLWLNIGDSYAGTGKSGGGEQGKRWEVCGMDTEGPKGGKWMPAPDGLKKKDLIGIPWMLAFALRADGWYLRQDIIWHKPNPMPESVTDRCTKAHEYIFLLSKSAKYFYDHEAVKEPAKEWHGQAATFDRGSNLVASHVIPGQTAAQHRPRPSKKRGEFSGKTEEMAAEGRNSFRAVTPTRNKRSVWPVESSSNRERECIEILESSLSTMDKWHAIKEMMGGSQSDVWRVATRPYKGAHFATFPPALIEPCILAGSRPGDIVLDPFMGSGTTAEVALIKGRSFLGCELNQEYGSLQDARIAAAKKTVYERDAQQVLFGT